MISILAIYAKLIQVSLTRFWAAIVIGIFCFTLFVTRAEPPETIVKPDASNQYQELQFFAKKGVQYTLQKTTDLKDWDNDFSFIGLGQTVKLRLFALNPSVMPQSGNDAPFLAVSSSVRRVSTGGTYFTWLS